MLIDVQFWWALNLKQIIKLPVAILKACGWWQETVIQLCMVKFLFLDVENSCFEMMANAMQHSSSLTCLCIPNMFYFQVTKDTSSILLTTSVKKLKSCTTCLTSYYRFSNLEGRHTHKHLPTHPHTHTYTRTHHRLIFMLKQKAFSNIMQSTWQQNTVYFI